MDWQLWRDTWDGIKLAAQHYRTGTPIAKINETDLNEQAYEHYELEYKYLKRRGMPGPHNLTYNGEVHGYKWRRGDLNP